jgi:hypothetical protein
MERLWSYQLDLREKESYELRGFTFVVATDDPQEALTRILRHGEIRSRLTEWKVSNFAGPHQEVFYA